MIIWFEQKIFFTTTETASLSLFRVIVIVFQMMQTYWKIFNKF